MTMIYEKVIVLGIGVSETSCPGLDRFEHWCKLMNLDYEIVGRGKKWNGGNMSAGPGGGQKINEIKQWLTEHPESLDRLIIVCDTFDLIPVADNNTIIDIFYQVCDDKHILFSSEIYCWPNKTLANSYPVVSTKYKYLNSGSIMCRANVLLNLIQSDNIINSSDDQLYYTLKYLSGKSVIKLDYGCNLFQAVNGAQNDLTIRNGQIYNTYTNTYPLFIHGNGPAKSYLNYLTNGLYFTKSVFLAVYIDTTEYKPSLMFLENIKKTLMPYCDTIYIYDTTYSDIIWKWCSVYKYAYVDNVNPSSYVFDDFKSTYCEYYAIICQGCVIEPNVFNLIIENCDDMHQIVGPLLMDNLRSNFNFETDGLNLSSIITKRSVCKLWNVHSIDKCLVIDGRLLKHYDLTKVHKNGSFANYNLCRNIADNNLFIYLDNTAIYGNLIN